jgi:hypothetical protein
LSHPCWHGGLTGPGFTNWDVTLGKNLPLWLGEGRTLRFRSEFYNVFNHTQFSQVNTTAQFDSRTLQQVNKNFGAFTAARAPRQISMSLRF